MNPIDSTAVVAVFSTQRMFISLCICVVLSVSSLLMFNRIFSSVTEEDLRKNLIEANRWKTIAHQLRELGLPAVENKKRINDLSTDVQRAIQLSVYESIDVLKRVKTVEVLKADFKPLVELAHSGASVEAPLVKIARLSVELELSAGSVFSDALSVLNQAGGHWPVETKVCQATLAKNVWPPVAVPIYLSCLFDIYHLPMPIKSMLSENPDVIDKDRTENFGVAEDIPVREGAQRKEKVPKQTHTLHFQSKNSSKQYSDFSPNFTGSVKSGDAVQIYLNGLPLSAYPLIRSGSISANSQKIFIDFQDGRTITLNAGSVDEH